MNNASKVITKGNLPGERKQAANTARTSKNLSCNFLSQKTPAFRHLNHLRITPGQWTFASRYIFNSRHYSLADMSSICTSRSPICRNFHWRSGTRWRLFHISMCCAYHIPLHGQCFTKINTHRMDRNEPVQTTFEGMHDSIWIQHRARKHQSPVILTSHNFVGYYQQWMMLWDALSNRQLKLWLSLTNLEYNLLKIKSVTDWKTSVLVLV